MNAKELIRKAMEDAEFLLNDEFETVTDKEIAERYQSVLNNLQKALEQLHKLQGRRFKWTNSLN